MTVHSYVTFTFERSNDYLLARLFLQGYVSPDAALPHQRLHHSLSDDRLTATMEADWTQEIDDTVLAALADYLLNPPVAVEDLPEYAPPPKDEAVLPTEAVAVIAEGEFPADIEKSKAEAEATYGEVKAVTADAALVVTAVMHETRAEAQAYVADTAEAMEEK